MPDIVLMHPEIPHNTGAVGRLCVGLGWQLHLIRPLGFAIDERHVKRAGLDYWEHLELTLHDTFEEYLEARHPSQLLFLSTKAKRSLYDTEIDSRAALVFGCETSGLPKDFYTRYADRLVTLPMPGHFGRSINLANAVAITAYEAYRQLMLRAGE